MVKYDWDDPRIVYRNSFEQVKRGFAENIKFLKEQGRWPDWFLRAIEREGG